MAIFFQESTRTYYGPIRQPAGLGVHFAGVTIVTKAVLPAFAAFSQIVTPRCQNNSVGDIARQAQSYNDFGSTTLTSSR